MARRVKIQDNTDYPSQPLFWLLKDARTWSRSNWRSTIEIMRRISGYKDWEEDQCIGFLESLINKYIEDEDYENNALRLQYAFGLHDRTKNLDDATSRRKRFYKDTIKPACGGSDSSEMKGEYARENALLKGIAEKLDRDIKGKKYKIDPSTGRLQRIEVTQTISKESTPSGASSADSLPDPQPGLSNNAGNLRLRNDYFAGRAEKLKAIRDNFDQGIQIQILHGMGGMGKTQLAVQYAYDNLESFDFVWMINGSNEGTIMEDCRAFLLSRGYKPSQLPDQAIRVLFVDYMNGHRNWLIIFDNCDYYGDEEMFATLKRFIPNNAPTGQILITSRTIQKLHKAAVIEITQMDEESAVTFLMDRSGCDDEKGARQLAKSLKYYPLAMEIAAAFIEGTPNCDFAKYIDLLQENGISLLEEKYDIQDYEQTVSEVWNITIKNIEKNGKTAIEKYCIRNCLLYCSIANYNHINLSLFACLSIIFIYVDPNLKVENLDERMEMRDETLIEEIAPLHIVCGNALARNRLHHFLVKYSLLQHENDQELNIHPVLQKVIFNSFYGIEAKVTMCWDLAQAHFVLWKDAVAYILKTGGAHHFVSRPEYSVTDHTEHLFSLLNNISITIENVEIDLDNEDGYDVFQLQYNGISCYRMLREKNALQLETGLCPAMKQFIEVSQSIDWDDKWFYASFAASIFINAIDYLYIKKPDDTAICINGYLKIIEEMIEYAPKNSFGRDIISLEMTVLFNVQILEMVFVSWTVYGYFEFIFPKLESVLQQIKDAVFNKDKNGFSYFGNPFTPDSIDRILEVFNAWKTRDYQLLPKRWRYSHFETKEARRARILSNYEGEENKAHKE